MSIFGKKGDDAQEDAGLTLEDPSFEDPALDDPMLDPGAPPSDLQDPAAEAPAATGDDAFGDFDAPMDDPLAGDDGAGLAAPTRKMAGGGGGRRNLLILVLLLVLAGIGGGYFYFMGEMPAPPAPVHVKADVPPAPAATPPAEMAAVDTMPPSLAPGDAIKPLEAPQNPLAGDTLAADPLAADPLGTDPLGADPLAAEDPMGMPAQTSAATESAPAETGTETGQEDPFGLGAPPDDEAAALAAADVMSPMDAPGQEEAPGMETPGMETPGMETPGMETPGMETPGLPGDLPMPSDAAMQETPASDTASAAPADAGVEDLPMPADAMVEQPPVAAAPAEEPPAWAAPGSAEIPGTTNPLAKPTSPTDAEIAIVQSAAVLDNMEAPKPANADGSAPAANAAPESTGAPFDPAGPKPGVKETMQAVEEILVKPAVVRPLPTGYMTIRKDSSAEDMDSRLTAARTALAQNRTPAALELFEDIKKDFPKDKRALMGRAVALQKLRQYDEALAAYEEVLLNDPKNLDALTNMLGLLKAKDPALAIDKLEELRNAYPYHADVTAQLGIAHATAGQYEPALKYLEMADALKPGSSFVMYNKAVLYDKMGRSREAGLLYRQILRMAADGELDQQLPLDSIRKRLAALR